MPPLPIPKDFGLTLIATHLNKLPALTAFLSAQQHERSLDLPSALKLYKLAFKLWPALDSRLEGGLPIGVRFDAGESGFNACKLLTVVCVKLSQISQVCSRQCIFDRNDIDSVNKVLKIVNNSVECSSNNSENQNHAHKKCTFLHNPPHPFATHAPVQLDKILKFGLDSLLSNEGLWIGTNDVPGPLHNLLQSNPGLSLLEVYNNLNVRVIELWEYEVGGGLVDSYHNDVDSILTIVIPLNNQGSDYTGGSLQTFECGGVDKVYKLEGGDGVCFVSHKYHNVGVVLGGGRRSLVVELWEGGGGHEGR